MKIILVDDEQLIVEGLKKIISRQFPDQETVGFTDPVRALEALKNAPADLVITDIRMPEMTGMQLIQRAKEAGLKYCAILTGLNDVPLLQESIRMQVCDYLIKPVNKEELYALIRRTQEQVSREQAEQADDLAEKFRSGAWEEARVAEALSARMRRSDEPPVVLREFLRAAERELPFWEVCRLAASVMKAEIPDAELGSRLRRLPVMKEPASPDIREILAAFRRDYCQDLTVNGMAGAMHLQPNYLTTLFKKETGKGFIQYLNQIRIEEACGMILTQPAMSLQDVAEKCGFPSPRYFFTVFKKMTGMTPGAFRDFLAEAGFIRL